MPLAITPGAYSALYAQQLQKTVSTMAVGAINNPAALFAQFSPSPFTATADAMIGNSVRGIDTMLASVGLGITTGLTPNPLETGNPFSNIGGRPNPMGGPIQPNPLATALPGMANPGTGVQPNPLATGVGAGVQPNPLATGVGTGVQPNPLATSLGSIMPNPLATALPGAAAQDISFDTGSLMASASNLLNSANFFNLMPSLFPFSS
jgi:hypothetical protein